MRIKERALLDESEDTQREHRRYRAGIVWFSTATGAFLLLLITGGLVGNWGTWRHIDTGPIAAVLITAGSIGICGFAWLTIWWWISIGGHDDYDRRHCTHPVDRLRKAERALRDYEP